MSNLIKEFGKEEFGNVRFVDFGGQPYAVGVDVAKVLEYSNPSKAIIQHCKGITKLVIPSEGGKQMTNIIPEGDIYRLIIKAADQSKNLNIKEKAEKFERWIFDEIIPQLRKQVSLEAFEAFKLMDINVQKQSSVSIANNGKLGSTKDNIVMNKNVNEITSLLYQIEPSINKGEMEKYYPEMLIDRQKILLDYCTIFRYMRSHTQTKQIIMQDVLKELKIVA